MNDLDLLAVNTIRILSAEAVQKANSGHPGMPMGAAGMAYVLWTRFLKHNPRNPHWPDRDRFVLSAGHGSMLLYSLLHLTGYDLPMDEIRAFRQWDSRTPGHPEQGHTPGVEVTTGPLGQGFAHGVGLAMAERFLGEHFNRPDHTLVDHYTYAIVSDGDLMEGISHEAASLAGHLRLGKLIYLFDDNGITIEGETSLATSEDVHRRFDAYGWQVLSAQGEDLDGIADALERARTTLDRPSLIAVRTHIGHGSPNKQDTADAHGAPLGDEELQRTKKALGWQAAEPFHVPPAVRDHLGAAIERGAETERRWRERLERYGESHPKARAEWDRWQEGRLPDDWDSPLWEVEGSSKPLATRAASGQAINALAPTLGNLIGGSADLAPSNNTRIKDRPAFDAAGAVGPNIHFGVREHAMAAAINGMALHGGLRPYGGTFLVFSDYMRPSLRLAAMMQAPSIFVFTHDSIGLGEDGPTHQPVEHLASLRAIPGLTVIRPADELETREAWWAAIRSRGPVALVLSRQKLTPLNREQMPRQIDEGSTAAGATAREANRAGTGATTGSTAAGATAGNANRAGAAIRSPAQEGGVPVARGAYVLAEAGSDPTPKDAGASTAPRLILIGTGSEVSICMQAREALQKRGIPTRVVSMPSWELFEQQPESYRKGVLPAGIPRLAVEAASPFGWERYTLRRDAVLGLERFGASAPAPVLFEKLGFTPATVVQRAVGLLETASVG